MRTTFSWAFWRRAQYLAVFGAIFVVIGVVVYFAYFHKAPTCFDNKQNNGEAGVDCGGNCVRICAMNVSAPTVKWTRSFRVIEGIYNAVAYVENTNLEAASPVVQYTFTLYDNAGIITERSGTTILPPDGLYPIFEGRIGTDRRVPTRTLIEIKPPEVWQPATSGREAFTVIDRTLSEADSRPRLTATLYNNSLEEVKEVEVVATIFDASGTALTTSRTFVDNFAPRTNTELTFTWPEPIARTVRSCEIPTDVMVTLDVSGSMNNDKVNPPEPLTSVKAAAQSFVNRLGESDRAGVATFASIAKIVSPLATDATRTSTVIGGLSIDPKEEGGVTDTGAGIRAAAAELQSERHNPDARKVLVLLTDGLATAPGDSAEAETSALTAAGEVKAAGIEIYTIGLGESVKMEFVSALASSPGNAHQALSASEVDRIYQTITSSLCEAGAAVIDVVPKSASDFVPLR